jgi:hypothetical protein
VVVVVVVAVEAAVTVVLVVLCGTGCRGAVYGCACDNNNRPNCSATSTS